MSYNSIISIIIAFIVFGIVVLVHEFGHFIVAIKNGILVEEFAIGMGPAIFKRKKGDTLYSIRLLPLGGYCKMLGEDEKNSDKRSFNNKSVVQRMAVIAAGAVMNFILAFFIILILSSINGFAGTKIDNVLDNSPAKEAGILKGDRIVKVNNKKIRIFEDLTFNLMNLKDKEFDLLIDRNKEKINVKIRSIPFESGKYAIGITAKMYKGVFNFSESDYDKCNILNTVSHAFWTLTYYIKTVFWGLSSLITFKVNINEMAGPVGIVNMIGDTYRVTSQISVWHTITIMSTLAALISANLGVFNLLPLPALDGGRLVFLIVEFLRGKPVSPEKEGMIHFIGFSILMLFILIITFNDITRIFF